MPNYELKKQVIDNGLIDTYRKMRLAIYSQYCSENFNKDFNASLETYLDINDYYYLHNREEWIECERIYNAHRTRVARLKKRIENMLNSDCLFLTLTFNNDTLSKTSAVTRRRYVTRFLKSFDTNFIANIDFGKTNHREHYHAILQKSMIDYSLWTYGAINGLKIVINNSTALSKYIAKLTNHAIKETTKGCRLIYSR